VDGDVYRFILTDDAGRVRVDLEQAVEFTEVPIDPRRCDPSEWAGPCRFAHIRFETPPGTLPYPAPGMVDAGADRR
jgi:hypothetical protein